MTRKTFLLGLFAVLILLQLPFAYRRYRLSRLNQAIQQLATQRVSQSPESEYLDYQGVIHVHSSLGGHSTGNFAELISAARANRLDFVIMTENPLVMFFDGLWSYGSYPDLMFADFFTRPTENLKRWDDAIAANNRKLVATAGNDAHSNVGLSVNDASGKQWLGIKLDPYQRSFRVVRIH